MSSKHVDPDTQQIRRLANMLIMFAVMGFAVSFGIIASNFLSVNRNGLEARFYPPTVDWTFREWDQEENGHWSAEIYFFKDRPECIFVRDQIITVTYVNPVGEIGESRVRFIGDDSPGNSRPGGWQRLDNRVEFLSAEVIPGTLIRANFLHQCHDGLPTVSGFKDIVVGQEMPWPNFVEEWMLDGMVGIPDDYR